ncbi:MAG: PEP-CTERM sorting domain-containing protein [Verrucomicrobiia bacterium]|jgi:hypothetical protein
MKPTILKTFAIVIASICGLLLANSVHAQVTGINTPAGSFASIQFNDTTSLNPLLQAGSTYSSSISPWGGASQALAPTTDPTTSDFAQGGLTAAVNAGNYSISLNNVVLNQALVNSGYANLIFQFDVQFQIGPGGLPIQPTVFPNFAINGTVLNVGGFASVTGFISYYGTATVDGVVGLMDTVNYNDTYNTPGNFNAIATGVPVNGFTDQLNPNSILTLVGNIDFRVDPADINVQTVPEPSTVGLVVVGLLGVAGLRRRRV